MAKTVVGLMDNTGQAESVIREITGACGCDRSDIGLIARGTLPDDGTTQANRAQDRAEGAATGAGTGAASRGGRVLRRRAASDIVVGPPWPGLRRWAVATTRPPSIVRRHPAGAVQQPLSTTWAL